MPGAPLTALDILRAELRNAEADRELHRARGHKGNLELSIAGFKAAWLKTLIAKIEKATK